MTPTVDIRRFDTLQVLAREAGLLLARVAADSIAARGCFIWALSGGQTPGPLYEHLARPPLRDAIRWHETIVIWTDERCVPPDDEGSNYRMATETLLNHVPIPADNILRIRGEDCALREDQRYEEALHRLLGNGGHAGRIDFVLLGVGNDGHTASLFPRSVALAERERWVLPVIGPEPYPHRITLTLPLINAARNVVVLATGARKSRIVRGIVQGEADSTWPILKVRPRDGGPTWIVDRDAYP